MFTKRGFFAQTESGVPTLYIYDDIGPTVFGMIGAELVIDQLADFGDAAEINVRINSQGGDVFEAFAIYNALLRHSAKVIVDVDALAASAASVIAMSGDTIRMAENAMQMIHDPWTLAIGNSAELQKTVEVLDKITETLVDTYVARAGDKSDAKTIRQQMRDETWFSADEAIAAGIADEIGQPMQIAAHVDPQLFARCPLGDPKSGSRRAAARFQRPAAAARPYQRQSTAGVGSASLAAAKARLAKARAGL